VPLNRPESQYDRQILEAIASGRPITQRSLSSQIGVALGLTNLLIRRLVAKGYVKVAKMGTQHIRYLMTTEGWEALGRATRQSLENTVHLYTETREHIRTSLALVSARCEPDASGAKRVIFYGAGDVAEIAFVSLQSTDLTLVGVVDDVRRDRFFNFTICPPEHLSAGSLGDIPYSHVVVTSLRHAESIRAHLDALAIPPSSISGLEPVMSRTNPGETA
jgi:DNA-binding MarR family transcriptional regulator